MKQIKKSKSVIKISIIILSYNVKDLLDQTLNSLKQSIHYAEKKSKNTLTFEVIVVDNASFDGADELVEKKHSWVKLVKNKENKGFSRGNNDGVRVSDKNSKYVMFLNNDIVLQEDTLYKMVEYMQKNKDVGLATCQVDLWSGGIDIDAHRGFPTPWRSFCWFSGLEKLLGRKFPKVFGGYHLLHKDLEKIHEIDACLGAFMIIPRKVGDKIGWWPEDYFLNGEDIDLAYQIKVLQGYRNMWVPTTKIIHYKGASKGTKKQSQNIIKKVDKSKKTLVINSGIQSQKIFYKKYYKEKYPFFVTWLVYFGIWLLLKKRLILGKE